MVFMLYSTVALITPLLVTSCTSALASKDVLELAQDVPVYTVATTWGGKRVTCQGLGGIPTVFTRHG